MHSLSTVLSQPGEAMYLCLGDHLQMIVDRFGFDGLGEAERTLWFASQFEAGVTAGGLLGYHGSPAWRFASSTVEALARVGATQDASVLRRAISLYEGDLEGLEELCSELACSTDDLCGLICAYARSCSGELLRVE